MIQATQFFYSYDSPADFDFYLAECLISSCDLIIGDVDMGGGEHYIDNIMADGVRQFAIDKFKKILEMCNES